MSSNSAAGPTPRNTSAKPGRPAGIRWIIAAAIQLKVRRQAKLVPNA